MSSQFITEARRLKNDYKFDEALNILKKVNEKNTSYYRLKAECYYQDLKIHTKKRFSISVFLALYEDIIFKRVKRKLSIIECQKEEDSSYTGKDIHTFDFDSLDIIDDYNMSKQENMLTSLKERKTL